MILPEIHSPCDSSSLFHIFDDNWHHYHGLLQSSSLLYYQFQHHQHTTKTPSAHHQHTISTPPAHHQHTTSTPPAPPQLLPQPLRLQPPQQKSLNHQHQLISCLSELLIKKSFLLQIVQKYALGMIHFVVSQKRKRGKQNSNQGGKTKRGRAGALRRPQINDPESGDEVNGDEDAEVYGDGVSSVTVDHNIRDAVLGLLKVSESTFAITLRLY